MGTLASGRNAQNFDPRWNQAQGRFREVSGLNATIQTITWPEPVYEVTLAPVQEAAGTAQLASSVAACFDAPSNLVAQTWLAESDSLSVDSNRVVAQTGDVRTYLFSSGITRMDIVRNFGSETLNVVVEAA